MGQQVTNFGRFYSAFHKPHHSWGAGRGKASVRVAVHRRAHRLPQGNDAEGVHRPLRGHRGNERHKGRAEASAEHSPQADAGARGRYDRLGADKRLLPPSANCRQSLRSALDRRAYGTGHQAPLDKAQGMAAQEGRTGARPGKPRSNA